MADNQHKITLMAYADGELDVEQTIKLLGEAGLCKNDEDCIRQAQQLRKACRSCLDDPASTKTPDSLADCIKAAFDQEQEGNPQPDFQASTRIENHKPVAGRITPWIPSGVAALFLLSGLAFWTNTLLQIQNGPNGTRTAQNTTLMNAPGTQIALAEFDAFAGRHGECARNTALMHDSLKLPTNIQALPGALGDYFGDSFDQTMPMDLAVLGFHYVKAGKCTLPTDGAIHVLYKPAPDTQATSPDAPAISLWISTKPGALASSLPQDHLFSAQTSEGKPVFIWRINGLSYFLVGDDPATTRNAVDVLSACAPARPQPVR
ncbi:anti-sigma factor [Mucisphaera calidilacus]|uniref:Uncharacterized protein n=1 Tax=Mucisphaera calidilacus TaxID=2527982 RepID=A0A518BTL8_9BACT|nr:hypothetical protein [Mucisphaera calidilacus]QDU70322.1 hypothetical protein Pan265_01450 [Mucisphaera calidilacus]